LKLANLARDGQLVQLARDTAASVLDDDPQQNLPKNQILWNRLKELNQKDEDWSRIS
jgi:ATP-dependent DNA helicase RecG